MIVWNDVTKKPSKYDGINRSYVKIICDSCGKERRETPTNARQLKGGGRICVTCSTAIRNRANSLYNGIEGLERRGGTAYIPTKCPNCSNIRMARANSKSLCRPCAAAKRWKFGVLDEHGKTCPRCKEYKPFAEYWSDRSNNDGYNVYCAVCAKERARMRGKRWHAGIRSHEWRAILEKYGSRCLACGKDGPLDADHIIAVAFGGENDVRNIQPLCRSCNIKKFVGYIDYRPDAYWANWT